MGDLMDHQGPAAALAFQGAWVAKGTPATRLTGTIQALQPYHTTIIAHRLICKKLSTALLPLTPHEAKTYALAPEDWTFYP